MVAVHRAELLWLVTTSVVWTVPVMATVLAQPGSKSPIGIPTISAQQAPLDRGEKGGPMKLLLLP
jgi:hypothetical protein